MEYVAAKKEKGGWVEDPTRQSIPWVRVTEADGNSPKAIKSSGHDIRVMLPGYSCINGRKFQIHNLLRMKDIGVPVAGGTELGWLMSTYSLMQLIFAPIWGALSDRYGRRPLLLASIFGTFLGFLLLGFANTLWILFAARIIDGFTGGKREWR